MLDYHDVRRNDVAGALAVWVSLREAGKLDPGTAAILIQLQDDPAEYFAARKAHRETGEFPEPYRSQVDHLLHVTA